MLYYGMLSLIILGSVTIGYILLGDTMQYTAQYSSVTISYIVLVDTMQYTTQYSEVGVGARNAHHDRLQHPKVPRCPN